MVDALIQEAIQNQSSSETGNEKKPKKFPSFAKLLTQKTRESIGAIQGHLPALTRMISESLIQERCEDW